MEFKIISKESNKLLDKDVIRAEMLFEGATPSRIEIKKEFAKKNKFNPELVVLKKIMNVFGERKLKLIIEIYKNEKALKNASKIYAKRDSKSGKEEPEKAAEQSSGEESKEEENKEAKPEENKEKAKDKEEPQKEDNENKAGEDKEVEESKDNKEESKQGASG